MKFSVKMYLVTSLCLFAIIHACWGQEATTSLGKVKGEIRTSLNGRKYAAFEGIPYAKPPVGDLRFERAVPAEPWDGVLDATKLHSCIQFVSNMPAQDEDCLYLNVYVPSESIDTGKNYDVVVHIHGGGFMIGAAYLLNAKYMMDEDYIVVSINYRLGPFGFLSTEDDVIPGNDGLKDQILALKWINNNINSFGGNPKSITLTGISAGGASTQLHYLSPLSKNLFTRGISHGGSALNPWVIKENPLENAVKLGGLLGCPTSPSADLKSCLKGKPANAFVEVTGEFVGYGTMPIAPFAPVVENGGKDPFITKLPYQILKNGDIYDVPYIMSTSTNEGLVLTGGLAGNVDEIEKIWVEVAHYILDYNYTLPESKRAEVADKIKNYYIGGAITMDSYDKFTQMVTDRIVMVGAETSTKLISKSISSPVYYYLFNYLGENNRILDVLYPNSGLTGICHTDDAIYFYGFLALNDYSDTDKKMWTTCQDLLFAYASTGAPKFDGVDWKPTKGDDLDYLKIDGPGKGTFTSTKDLSNSPFWESLGFNEY